MLKRRQQLKKEATRRWSKPIGPTALSTYTTATP
jgi:hypothetical protein